MQSNPVLLKEDTRRCLQARIHILSIDLPIEIAYLPTEMKIKSSKVDDNFLCKVCHPNNHCEPLRVKNMALFSREPVAAGYIPKYLIHYVPNLNKPNQPRKETYLRICESQSVLGNLCRSHYVQT